MIREPKCSDSSKRMAPFSVRIVAFNSRLGFKSRLHTLERDHRTSKVFENIRSDFRQYALLSSMFSDEIKDAEIVMRFGV